VHATRPAEELRELRAAVKVGREGKIALIGEALQALIRDTSEPKELRS
jgi:hypothetical protein